MKDVFVNDLKLMIMNCITIYGRVQWFIKVNH